MNDLSKLQKGILMTLLAMTVLFAVLTGVVRSQKGVLFRETLLKVEQTAQGTVYEGTIQGVPVRITVTPEGETVTTVEYQAEGQPADVYTMEYPVEPIRTEHGSVSGVRVLKNGAVLFQGGYDPEQEFLTWFDENGDWDADITITGVYDGYARDLELSKSNVAYFAQGPELTARGSWGYYLLIVLMTALLAFDVWYPTALFYMQHACDVRDPEPSDFYITSQKISWVVYTCGLLIAHIYILTHIW